MQTFAACFGGEHDMTGLASFSQVFRNTLLQDNEFTSQNLFKKKEETAGPLP